MPPKRVKKDGAVQHNRQRLLDLRSSSHLVSVAGLASVVEDIRTHGLPTASSRATQWRARTDRAGRQNPYGSLARSLEVNSTEGLLDIWVQNPASMFYESFTEAPTFNELIWHTAQNHPPSPNQPWTLVCYVDEIGFTPMKHDRRKLQALYWSVLEFGANVLACESAWFIAAVVRSDICKMIPGSVSHIWRRILKELFFNPEGFDWSTAGCILDTLLVFLAMGFFCADIPALKDVMKFVGHSGVKLCHLCPHIVSVRSQLSATVGRSTYYQLSTDTNIKAPRKCHTDASIRALLEELSDAHAAWVRKDLTKGAYDELCKDYGWTHDPENILLDEQLGVGGVSMCMYDWMHIFLVNGLFNVEVLWLVTFLKHWGYDYDSLDRFFRLWCWPRNSKAMQQIFSSTGSRPSQNSDHFACSASEGLGVYAVLRAWLLGLPAGVCVDQISSFLSLCTVLDLLQNVKLPGKVSHAQLHTAIVAHLEAFKRAYGDVGWLPKHHFALHLSGFLRRWDCLLGLWVQERRHSMSKRCGSNRRNTTAFEKGMMEDMTIQHLADLKRQPSFIRTVLENPKPCKPSILSVLESAFGPQGIEPYLCSSIVHCQGIGFRCGQLCAFHDGENLCYGQVWFHADVHGTFVSCLQASEQTAGDNFQLTFCMSSSRHCIVNSSSLIAPCVFREVEDQRVVLKPHHVL